MEKISVSITSKTLWMALAMVVGVFVFWQLRNFVMVMVLSVIIASFVEAGTRTMQRIRIPRTLAVFIMYAVGFGIIAGMLYLVVPLFIREIIDFIDLFPKNSFFVKLITPIADNGLTATSIKEIFASKTLLAGTGDVFGTVQSIFGGLVNTMLVVIISFYLAIQERGIEQFLRVVTPKQYEEYVVGLWARTERKIGYWFGGQALVAILVGIVTYIGLFFLGVPYALLLSAISGLFVFVPFGTGISMAPAIALGYLASGVGLAFQIFIFYGVVHYIEAYFFTPYILHRTIGMPMLVIILSVIACFELFGIIGVVIAVPLAVLILEMVYDRETIKRG